jgi:MFS family permease
MVALRYVLQAGVYRVLYRLEEGGVAPTVSAAFSEGWHRRTWRLFLQNLLVGLVVGVVMAFFAAMITLPALLLLSDNSGAHWAAVAGMVVWGMLTLVVILLLTVVLSVLSRFWWRAAIIDDMGAVDAMGYAWHLVKTHFSDVAVVWLLMFGVGLLFGMVMLFFMLFLLALAAMTAGLPGYLLYEATGSIFAGLLWGVPAGLAILILPTLFVTGLYLIFNVAVWNDLYLRLTHSELETPS